MLMKREYLENCPQEGSYLAKNSSFLEEFNTPCIMKRLCAILICLSPMLLAAQEEGYRMHSYAEEGVGYYQERGKAPVLIQEGDVVQCDPNTEHWHASSKEHDVTYLAIYSGETTWTEALTREDYDAVAYLLTTEK